MDKSNVAQQHAVAVVAALLPMVREMIRAELAAKGSGDLVAHNKIPVPRRVSCAAAAAGEVDGARKVGRAWLASRSSWDRWLDAVSAKPANDGDSAVLDVARAAARRAR